MTAQSSHLVVTRFAVPRDRPGTASLYRDPHWLAGRHELFRRYFVPSVAPLGVPVILLCGEQAAAAVAEAVADLPWARVEVQDDWHAGWRGRRSQVITRLDSDDAVHPEWFAAVDEAPASARICITHRSLRYHPRSGRLQRYRRREAAPLAAFRGGSNPYAIDHRFLASQSGVHTLRGPYLLQVVHGGNVKNRPPKAWRLDRWTRRSRLREFGLSP
ncbi:MAG: hypothetical protein AAF604_00690 [Acidobacteriota bacterium]